MAIPIRYAEWRSRLREYLSDKETPLDLARMIRYALLQGPWQPWMIHHYQRHGRNPRLPSTDRSMFEAMDVAEAVRRLNVDAFAAGWRVPAGEVAEIAAYARATGEKRSDDPHRFCEAARRIALDPQVLEVARGYLRAEPILNSSKLYWTMPPRGDRDGQLRAAAEGGRFHYDLADLKAVTLFIYLTDVDADCGPHVVVRGTQGRKRFAQIFNRFIAEDEIQRRFPGRMHVITGERGTAWFEDISCYHKQAAAERTRLMLSIIYSLHRQPLAEERARRGAAARSGRAAGGTTIATHGPPA